MKTSFQVEPDEKANAIIVALFLALAWSIPCGLAEPAKRQWRRMPNATVRSGRILQMARDNQTLWAHSEQLVYWDGAQWQLPDGPRIKCQMHATVFVGGNDRPLYITQVTQDRTRAALYRLKNNEIARVTDFEYAGPITAPTLHVGLDGTLFNFSNEQPFVFDGQNWQPIATKGRVLAALDALDSVFLFDDQGGVTRVEEQEVTRVYDYEQPDNVKRGVIRVLWGKNRMLAIPRYDRYLFGCDLETGEALELTELNEQLKDVTIEQIGARRDGSVWLIVSDKRYGPCRIIELSLEGKLRPIEHAVGLGQPNLIRGGRFIESKDHATWISLSDSIVKITDENLVTYGQDTGYHLGGCDLVLTADGSLFCCNGSAYCYTQDPQLLALSPAPRSPIQSDVVWSVAPERRRTFDAAFKSRDSLVVTRKRDPQLVFDISTGEHLNDFELGDKPRESLPHIPWLFRGAGSRQMLATGKKIYSLNAQSQEITNSQSLQHDYRIAPVMTEEGMLIVPKSRGREIQLLDPDGQPLWTAELPGYVRGQLAVNANQVIVQTRGSSYGGQATTALDITTGEQLWSEVIDAYGNGATAGTRKVPFVESAYWMSPNENKGWIIGRRPDGSRAWTFEVDSLQPMIPIVDRNNLRVFGIFVDGTVVCLQLESGEELWRHQLPEALPDFGMVGSYGASFPIHQFRDGLLLVVDRNMVLNVLDGSLGKELARIRLGSTESGLSASAKKMIAAPWVTDSLIVTAYQDEIVAVGKPLTFPTPLPEKPPILSDPRVPPAKAWATTGSPPTCKCMSCACRSASGPLRRVLGKLRSRCRR